MNIKDIQEEIHMRAKESGWWDRTIDRNIPTKLALIHSEVSEALEEYRDPKHTVKDIYFRGDGKPEGVAIELADIIIRVLDLAEYYGFNMEEAIRTKMNYNKTRPHRHGDKKV